MKKLLLSFAFILPSLCMYAQSEHPGDTIKNLLPVKKDQVPSFPKKDMPPSRTGAFSNDQPKQDTRMPQPDSVTLHVTPPEYVEPLPWMDMEKIHFMSNLFEMDYERFADFLLSPQVIMQMYSSYTTYPTMGSMRFAGAQFTYFSPNERWELSGGIYAAHYSMPTPGGLALGNSGMLDRKFGPQFDLGFNASVAYRITDHLRIRAFGQYSGYGRSNSFKGYMNPMYPQSHYGIIMEVKVNDWLDVNGGMERIYDPTKMKWVNTPVFGPTIRIKK